MYIVRMRGLILIISSLLLMLLTPMDKLMGEQYAVNSLENCRVEGNNSINDSQVIHSDDVLYDGDVVTLLTTYDFGNDDVVPRRVNQWGQQFRLFTTRLQFRYHSLVLQVKKMTRLLANYLTTLINHISQFYSSLHSLCWQYAADCYVFAFRQIII